MNLNPADSKVCVWRDNAWFVVIGLYVYVLLIACKGMSILESIKFYSSRSCKMTDLGESPVALGMKIHQKKTAKTFTVFPR